jgi:hypothetical protein
MSAAFLLLASDTPASSGGQDTWLGAVMVSAGRRGASLTLPNASLCPGSKSPLIADITTFSVSFNAVTLLFLFVSDTARHL